MKDAAKDLVLSLVLFALGLGALLYIQYGPGVALQVSRDAQITFRSFPTAIAGLLMLLTALYAAASALAWVRAAKGGGPTGPIPVPPLPYVPLRVAAVVVLLIGFTLLLGKVPLFALAAIFLFIAFFIFGTTRWARMAVVALAGGAFFHGLFVVVLKLPLN